MGELTYVAPRLVRRGYDRRQVDAFMLRVEQTLMGNAAKPVTARELVTARFRRVMPLSRGYVCADVDAFLFDVAPAIMRCTPARDAAPRQVGALRVRAARLRHSRRTDRD